MEVGVIADPVHQDTPAPRPRCLSKEIVDQSER
jgi:hypothetical protein